jgi:hypothetical protein
LITSIKHIKSHLAFWAPFAFRETDFHKIKSRDALNRAHDDLNPTDYNMALSTSLHQLSHGMFAGTQNFCLWNFFDFKNIFFVLYLVKTVYNKSTSKVSLQNTVMYSDQIYPITLSSLPPSFKQFLTSHYSINFPFLPLHFHIWKMESECCTSLAF